MKYNICKALELGGFNDTNVKIKHMVKLKIILS